MRRVYTTRLSQFTVSFPNTQEFHQLKREIFSQHIYYLDDELEAPTIIDAGAHIGLATLYFKSMWPDAQILAIEPNPVSREYLELNLEQNQIQSVTIEPVALSTRAGEETLYVDASGDEWQSTASFHPAAWTNTQPGEPITVATQALSHYLTRPVDILKMDIEGVEERVLLAAGPTIRQVAHLFIEFHGRPGNSLPPIIEYLHQHGFDTQVWKDRREVDPERVVGLAIVEAHRKT